MPTSSEIHGQTRGVRMDTHMFPEQPAKTAISWMKLTSSPNQKPITSSPSCYSSYWPSFIDLDINNLQCSYLFNVGFPYIFIYLGLNTYIYRLSTITMGIVKNKLKAKTKPTKKVLTKK